MSQPPNPLVAAPQDDATATATATAGIGVGVAESAADAYNGIADQSLPYSSRMDGRVGKGFGRFRASEPDSCPRCPDAATHKLNLVYDACEAYAKVSLKKYRPIAARNEDEKVFSGLL